MKQNFILMKNKSLFKPLFFCCLMITLQSISCKKESKPIGPEQQEPPSSITESYVFTDKDSNYLYRFPDYINSKYDPRKIYWVNDSGIVCKSNYAKYSYYNNKLIFVWCSQIDSIDTGQLVSFYLSSLIHGGKNYFYIHLPDGDIDTLMYDGSKDYNEGGYREYNGKPVYWYKGGSKLNEYVAHFIIVK